MIDQICSHQSEIFAAIGSIQVLLHLLEYWLGVTDRVKAASVVEAIINGLKALTRREK